MPSDVVLDLCVRVNSSKTSASVREKVCFGRLGFFGGLGGIFKRRKDGGDECHSGRTSSAKNYHMLRHK